MSESFDPKRRLCPDGSCIGVIGADGRCTECGRSVDGKPRVLEGGASTAGGAEAEADADADADAELQASPEDDAAPRGDGAAGFDPGRRLCPDGSCVGVIGADGRCGVCGQEAA
jgi:hypothetical protein